MKIAAEVLKEAISSYEDCIPMVEIAGWIGVSRQGLWKAFRAAGVETRKLKASRRKVKCDTCGGEYEVTRSRYRLLGKRKFCSEGCYHEYLADDNSISNRHKQRVARAKVSEVFDLKAEHVVHHKDKDNFNTELSNFMVFKNQSEHMRYHHQLRQGEVTVEAVFDGESTCY